MTAADPIRVLRVIARLNVGGPALHVSYLSSLLDERGYRTMLAAGTVGEEEGSMEYAARELGVEPVLVPSLRRELSPVGDAHAVVHLVRMIRAFRPHILHTHTAKAGALGRLAALLAPNARPQVVVHTFHGHVLRGYFSPWATEVFRRVERSLASRTDALIAVSPEVRDDLVALGVATADRIEVVRLGLDLDRRLRAPDGSRERVRAELGISSDAFLVGWLGRMTEIKRADHMLEAFAALRRRGVDAHLAVVGDGPLRSRLEALARELGIVGTTHFLGYRDGVGPLYAAFDAVALTSANEGTPVSLIEALAAGIPVVATGVGGVPDVVDHGRSGFVVAPGDLEGVAARLAELAGDAALRARLGEAGARDVTARYSVERLAGDVDALYRQLLERPSARRQSKPLRPALPELANGVAPAERPLRILVFSQYFPPEVGATQTRMQAFAEYLAARGHHVTVICEVPNHPHGVIPSRYRGRLFEDDRSNPYRVLRVWVWTSPEKTQVTRMQFYLSYMALAGAVTPLAGQADVVLATSPPLFAGVAGLFAARVNRAPFILDVRDLWPAAAISLDQLSNPVAAAAADRLEKWLYRRAAAAVAVTRPFCEHIDGIRDRGPKTTFIPNGTLEQFFSDGEGDRAALGVTDDRFLAVFAGMHGIAQGLSSLLDAAARADGDVHFALIGDGPVKDALAADASARGLDNVHFHRQVPLESTPGLLRAGNALLVPLSAHPTFETFVPSKMIDFMAVGRPIVLSAAGEAARILDEAGAGIAVRPEDPEALLAALKWLRANPTEAAEMGRRGRDFARGWLRSSQAAQLEGVLLDAVERGPNARR